MPKIDKHFFDTRLITRNIRDGVITEEQYKDHLKNLEDMTGKFDIIEIKDLEEDRRKFHDDDRT